MVLNVAADQQANRHSRVASPFPHPICPILGEGGEGGVEKEGGGLKSTPSNWGQRRIYTFVGWGIIQFCCITYKIYLKD